MGQRYALVIAQSPVSERMRAIQDRLSDPGDPVTFGPPPTPEAIAAQARAKANRLALREAAERGISPREAGYVAPVHVKVMSPFGMAKAAAAKAASYSNVQTWRTAQAVADDLGTEDLGDLDQYLEKDEDHE